MEKHSKKQRLEAAERWKRMKNWLRGRGSKEEESAEFERLRQEIEAAHQEWAIAQQHIDYVFEPELIDHAIFSLEAAERKYSYLLREAKKRYEHRETSTVELSP